MYIYYRNENRHQTTHPRLLRRDARSHRAAPPSPDAPTRGHRHRAPWFDRRAQHPLWSTNVPLQGQPSHAARPVLRLDPQGRRQDRQCGAVPGARRTLPAMESQQAPRRPDPESATGVGAPGRARLTPPLVMPQDCAARRRRARAPSPCTRRAINFCSGSQCLRRGRCSSRCRWTSRPPIYTDWTPILGHAPRATHTYGRAAAGRSPARSDIVAA